MRGMFSVDLQYAPTDSSFMIVADAHGAAFLDSGNIWLIRDDESRPDGKLKASRFLKDLALGTGIGLRYDLEYLVVRVDWGIGLHGNLSIGLLAARANFEGPIIKDRSSFNVSFRRSWMDLITWPVLMSLNKDADRKIHVRKHFIACRIDVRT